MTPFNGLKIIELSSVLAGPSVGMFFAELGAEVIKIENANSAGDMTRQWKSEKEDTEGAVSAYFSSINYKKTYRLLDFSEAKDLQEVHDLISSADIVICNLKPDSAKRFELDAKSLLAQYPSLIHGHISGFDSTVGKTAFDMVLQAETGFLSMTGTTGGEVCKIPIAMIDVIAAHQLKEGILIALIARARTGRGASVRTSLERSALTALINQGSNYLMAGKVAKPMGTLHPNIAPYGEVVMTTDGTRFILAIGTDKQFQAMCDLLSIPEVKDDPEFSNNPSRVSNRQRLHSLLSDAILQVSAKEFEQSCLEMKVPVGRIKDISEVMKTQAAKEMIRTETIEGIETKRLSSIGFQIK